MAEEWEKRLDDLCSGTDSALARVISHVENRAPGWDRIMRALFPKTGRARIVGITGSGGVGKSTLTGRIAARLVQTGHSVGIIAIDPSSPFTGGALLGDRLRMQIPTDSNAVFLRSMATRNFPGGICRAARDTVRIMDAFGKDYVLVETVGIGQNQVDVAQIVSVVMLVCAPGQGDGIQMLKSGIFEAADLFVVNKADLPGADLTIAEIQGMLALGDPPGPAPRVLKACALQADGVDAVVRALEDLLSASDAGRSKHEALIRRELAGLLETRLAERFMADWLPAGAFERAVQHAADRRQDPYTVIEDLIGRFFPRKSDDP